MKNIRVYFPYTDIFLSLCNVRTWSCYYKQNIKVMKVEVEERREDRFHSRCASLSRGLMPLVAASILSFMPVSCEELDNDIGKHSQGDGDSLAAVSLSRVASLLAELPIEEEQLAEVYDAVTASSENGYDEEYMMSDLFRLPGAGVGDDRLPAGTKSPVSYQRPMRDLIIGYLESASATKAGGGISSGYGSVLSPEEFVSALENSDIQIYWPFSENWDGQTAPVITFDPMDGSETNVGYEVVLAKNGDRLIREVAVNEKMAEERPVWVVNMNDDSGHTSLELLRRQDPDWGSGGGEIIVGMNSPASLPALPSRSGDSAGASGSPLRTLVLKEFTMLRNYDSWFAGASEFFVKMGSVENFTASTEAELKLYNPSVTDFMIVVKRKNVGVPQPFNAVLVSEWTDQLASCAFMIVEDDGGTRTSWKCTALVRIESKSYGFELEIPINSRDDIVWRGQLSSRYILANDNVTGHFGDVDLKFQIVEYPGV